MNFPLDLALDVTLRERPSLSLDYENLAYIFSTIIMLFLFTFKL